MLNNILFNSRRAFVKKSAILMVGIPFAEMLKFDFDDDFKLQHNVPQTVLDDPRVKLKFDVERMVIEDGLQPSMLCTRSGTLIVQSQNSNKPLPQQRIFYPYAMSTVVSRDGGENWNTFHLNPNDNGVDMEGGILELKDGTIIVLETFVTPGDRPGTGKGLLFTSSDDYQTLQGPIDITIDLPGADFYNSSDDAGRPHTAMRFHRRIIELPNGDLITTLYGWFKDDNQPSEYTPTMNKTRVMLLRSKNKGKHWDFVSSIFLKPEAGTEGFAEPVIVRLSKEPNIGRLICMMRTGRELYETYSDDEGKTWSKAEPRVFGGIDVYKTSEWADMFEGVKRGGVLISENPNEFIGAVVEPDLIELRSGILVAAFGVRIPARANFTNPSHPWNGNYLAFSLDHGNTWSQVTRLTTGIPTTHYMAIEETPENNKLFVAYDFGYWRAPQGRYTYGRHVTISVDND